MIDLINNIPLIWYVLYFFSYNFSRHHLSSDFLNHLTNIFCYIFYCLIICNLSFNRSASYSFYSLVNCLNNLSRYFLNSFNFLVLYNSLLVRNVLYSTLWSYILYRTIIKLYDRKYTRLTWFTIKVSLCIVWLLDIHLINCLFK